MPDGFTGYVWTEAESAKKKLRIHKNVAQDISKRECSVKFQNIWDDQDPLEFILRRITTFLFLIFLFRLDEITNRVKSYMWQTAPGD